MCCCFILCVCTVNCMPLPCNAIPWQTFFVDEDLRDRCMLDAVLTVADCKHLPQHLDEVKPAGVVNEAGKQRTPRQAARKCAAAAAASLAAPAALAAPIAAAVGHVVDD
jgi:hypothetical protein